MKEVLVGEAVKGWKKISTKTKLIIIASIAVLFTVLFPIICSVIGGSFGTSVGTAVGTFHAVTEDMPKAYAEGKTDGLSAEDTEVGINKVKEVGKLDVLAANAKLTDVHKVGDKYAALYEMGADVIFSVDVSQASFLYGDNLIVVLLPPPEAEINFDSTKTKVVADWQSWLPLFGNGSTKDGLDAYFNSLKKIKINAKEQIENYDYLEKQASDSAKKQVKELAQMLVEKGTNVEVKIQGTEDGEIWRSTENE